MIFQSPMKCHKKLKGKYLCMTECYEATLAAQDGNASPSTGASNGETHFTNT